MALDDHHKHYIGVVAQKALIEQDGKILLVQYPSTDHYLWDLPGGRLHNDETAIEGLVREVTEEIGAPIEMTGIVTTLLNHGTVFDAFVVIYRARLANPGQPLVPEAGEIGHIEWKDKKECLDLPFASPGIKEALKPFLV